MNLYCHLRTRRIFTLLMNKTFNLSFKNYEEFGYNLRY